MTHFRHNQTANVVYADGHCKAAASNAKPIANSPNCGYLSSDDSLYDLN